MTRLTALIVTCVVLSSPTSLIAQEQPTSIVCRGKAISAVPDPTFSEISLSASFNYEQTLEVVLVDGRTGRQEEPFRQEVAPFGVDSGPVPVRTGSLTVDQGRPKAVLKILWQKASMSSDFIGFVITLGYTSVLQVDTVAYGNAPKGTQMRFSFFDGLDTILYQGTCAAH